MIKAFHELTDSERDKLFKNEMTCAKLAEDYPQPDWCEYPDAVSPLGCWGLIFGHVHDKGKEYCSVCELNKTKKLSKVDE